MNFYNSFKEIGFLKSLDASYKDDIITTDGELQDKYTEKINMQKGAYLNTEYLGIFLNGDDQIVKNKWLRKAINYGFDREKNDHIFTKPDWHTSCKRIHPRWSSIVQCSKRICV